MPSGTVSSASELDSPGLTLRAGRDLLSLALIDSRNRLLALLAVHESALGLQRAASAGHFQEWWIARHVQRSRGERCDAGALRLATIEPHAEAWANRTRAVPPDALRRYLQDSLEVTLDLLASSAEDDDALYFYRLALLHEDRVVEAMALDCPQGAPPALTLREPIWLPAQDWALGSTPGGLVPQGERWAHEVRLPECEIDAQPVSWAQFVEFAHDGGYDRSELWSGDGWAWVQQQERRAPRGVEQLGASVLVARAGKLQRAGATQPVQGVSRFEAEAWCTWAGRRLPTEPEWELAACTATRRGFSWGHVREWVAGSARPWPGTGAVPPGELDPLPRQPGWNVQRGASAMLPLRSHHTKARHFATPGSDDMSVGFRSCAL